ncbi:hypothetical protein SAMN06297251_11536 [Fulvimarina manganoxydans]|uniref:Uncharacterized protein n=1 Tax=Fulvimarina manganoxydans TaxID=937218 RepID=A0A1W2DH24_9HYPH|nr:hypothetical protein SAMN06297251_11536 [Fulvimarina manganoxydans]
MIGMAVFFVCEAELCKGRKERPPCFEKGRIGGLNL